MLSPEHIKQSFTFDPSITDQLKQTWLSLLDTSIWGDLKTNQIGIIPRLQKRLLELGQNFRSLLNDRSWIPQPREQVKGAMGAALNLRDALLQTDKTVKQLTGGEDFKSFTENYLAFHQSLLQFIEKHEMQWANILESLYHNSETDDTDD